LAAQVIYDAASETQWLIGEGEALFEGIDVVYNELVEALGILAQRWQVAGRFQSPRPLLSSLSFKASKNNKIIKANIWSYWKDNGSEDVP
jgi:hypothetical protein